LQKPSLDNEAEWTDNVILEFEVSKSPTGHTPVPVPLTYEPHCFKLHISRYCSTKRINSFLVSAIPATYPVCHSRRVKVACFFVMLITAYLLVLFPDTFVDILKLLPGYLIR
jgi:hypothetical protein